MSSTASDTSPPKYTTVKLRPNPDYTYTVNFHTSARYQQRVDIQLNNDSPTAYSNLSTSNNPTPTFHSSGNLKLLFAAYNEDDNTWLAPKVLVGRPMYRVGCFKQEIKTEDSTDGDANDTIIEIVSTFPQDKFPYGPTDPGWNGYGPAWEHGGRKPWESEKGTGFENAYWIEGGGEGEASA